MGAWGAIDLMRIWGLEASVKEIRTFTNGLNKQKHAKSVIKKDESWDHKAFRSHFQVEWTSQEKTRWDRFLERQRMTEKFVWRRVETTSNNKTRGETGLLS